MSVPADGFSFSAGLDVPTDTARYRVIERLGRGGNSDVYLCQAKTGDLKGLLFAVKLMTRVDRRDRIVRFLAELEFLTSIDHPGVMRVFDSGTQIFGPPSDRKEVPFYVAEYLPKTLREVMRAGLLILEKVSIAVQLVASLEYLASRNPQIVHRDIKPENIFIRGRTPVIGDFGLLKALGAEGINEAFSLGELSKGIRFPRLYPTPELIEYAKDESVQLTPKSDVFQMGIVFSELFCDFFPIEDRERPLSPIVVRDLPPIGGGQGTTLRNVISKMLDLDPASRPDAEDVSDSLEGIFNEVRSDAHKLEGKAFW